MGLDARDAGAVRARCEGLLCIVLFGLPAGAIRYAHVYKPRVSRVPPPRGPWNRRTAGTGQMFRGKDLATVGASTILVPGTRPNDCERDLRPLVARKRLVCSCFCVG